MVLHDTLVFITLYSKVYHTIGELFIALSTYVCPIKPEYFLIPLLFVFDQSEAMWDKLLNLEMGSLTI